MWRYLFLIVKLIKITNMSDLYEKAMKFASKYKENLISNSLQADNDTYVAGIEVGYIWGQKECEEKLRWIPVEEKLPEASPDKNDWWTSDIGEVFPYSKKCVVENYEGELFINNYSVIENCWVIFCGTIVKWRFL